MSAHNTFRISILSHFAGESFAMNGFEHPCSSAADADLHDDIFRFFNRVTIEDGGRLENIGYSLPSLSVGDVLAVTWTGNYRQPRCEGLTMVYKVVSDGFEEISSTPLDKSL